MYIIRYNIKLQTKTTFFAPRNFRKKIANGPPIHKWVSNSQNEMHAKYSIIDHCSGHLF